MASEYERALEAILMVAQEPVDPHLLAQLLEVSPDRVDELCDGLAATYAEQDRGFVLVKVAGGYRFQSHGDLAPYVERFVLEGQSARLSAAALETLAIVAYKQPMSRAQVAAIRGVNVDGVMRTLQQRGYIAEVGRDPGPGQATLFGTTDEFLERLGLASIGDLPPIADLFPGTDIMEALERTLRADPVEKLPLDGQTTRTPGVEQPRLGDADPGADPEAGPDAPEPGPVATHDESSEGPEPADEAVIDLADAVVRDEMSRTEPAPRPGAAGPEPVPGAGHDDDEHDEDDDDDLAPPAWALDDPPAAASTEDRLDDDDEHGDGPGPDGDAHGGPDPAPA